MKFLHFFYLQEELPTLLVEFSEFQQRSREHILSSSTYEDTGISDNLDLSHSSPTMVFICYANFFIQIH